MQNKVLYQITTTYKQEYGIPLQIRNTRILSGGCISNALKLETNEGQMFLKWNSGGPEDMFIKEAESLNEFHKYKNDFIVFPKPILVKSIDQLPGYLLTNYLEPGHTDHDDEHLGYGLAQLHQQTNEQYGFSQNNYCGATLQNNTFQADWGTFYIENRVGYLINQIRKSGGWDYEDERLSDRFLKRVPELIAYPNQPALIHGDLWSGNYMYTTKAPALIDPCACYCDREFEMGMMTMFGGFSQTVYAAYNEVYPLLHDWRERNLIYQLYHVLNHYFLFGGYYKKQALDIMKHYL